MNLRPDWIPDGAKLVVTIFVSGMLLALSIGGGYYVQRTVNESGCRAQVDNRRAYRELINLVHTEPLQPYVRPGFWEERERRYHVILMRYPRLKCEEGRAVEVDRKRKGAR